MKKHNKTLVYDLPTRIFHWLFAFLFLAAYIIAQTADDEGSLFSYHMLAGLSLAFVLVLRLVWGFAGTLYARFSSFKLSPAELAHYLKDAVAAKTKRYLGHNPGSSYATMFMFICILGLASTGILMASGYETEFYEESHELLATLFLITVIAHVAGVLFHHLRHKDTLWSSMLDGKKDDRKEGGGISNPKTVTGIIILMLTLSWMGYLLNRYDSDTRKLDLFGTELHLGEEDSADKSHEAQENDDD